MNKQPRSLPASIDRLWEEHSHKRTFTVLFDKLNSLDSTI
jgi:uncharacterized protein YdcH (DUF465 family)